MLGGARDVETRRGWDRPDLAILRPFTAALVERLPGWTEVSQPSAVRGRHSEQAGRLVTLSLSKALPNPLHDVTDLIFSDAIRRWSEGDWERKQNALRTWLSGEEVPFAKPSKLTTAIRRRARISVGIALDCVNSMIREEFADAAADAASLFVWASCGDITSFPTDEASTMFVEARRSFCRRNYVPLCRKAIAELGNV